MSLLFDKAYEARHLMELSATKAREIRQNLDVLVGPPKAPFIIDEDKLVIVVPSEDLGLTADFSGGERATRLMRRGELDMEAALKANERISILMDAKSRAQGRAF